MQSASSTSSSEHAVSARDSRKFGIRALAGVFLSAVVWTLCTLVFLRGETDDAYLRVASPAHSSLILGTSRAAQGLYPKAFSSAEDWFAGPMYNFAFTNSTSPWGPTYLRAIEMKLAPARAKPGLFVLEVNPLAFNVDPKVGRREDKSFLARLHSVTSFPNPEYPFYQSQRGVDILEGLLHMALGRVRKRLHPDGWLEISLEDQASRYAKRLEQKLSQNKHSFEATVESPERWDAFKRTVQMLQARGRVCLARLPVAPQVFALEQAAAPDFDDKISAVAHAMGVPFINLMDMSDRVSTTDGSHISKASAPEVATELLARLPTEWRN